MTHRNPLVLLATCLGILAVGCSGRVAPPSAASVAFDDATVLGGVIPANDASLPEEMQAATPTSPPVDSSTPALAPPPGDDAQDPMPPPGPPFDAGADGVCSGPPAAGDLAVDELMIESVSGTGDHGEWLEVTSTRDCALNLRGLHGECPRGAKAATFDLSADFWVPAFGTFVVADSVSPAVNHDVPQPVVAWRGNLGDVLRNKGGTVTLRMNDAVVDTLTFPALTLTVGASIAFPAGCDPVTRSDFTRWQTSTASWFPGFRGTPNAPNTDVACAP